MDEKVCSKCGKQLNEYEISLRIDNDKTLEMCNICAMAFDMKKGDISLDDSAPTEKPTTVKTPNTAKPTAQKKTPVDIDSLFVSAKSEKPEYLASFGKVFNTNNNTSYILRIAAFALFAIGFVVGVIVMFASQESFNLVPAIICWISGIVISLILWGIAEIISLLQSIYNKMK